MRVLLKLMIRQQSVGIISTEKGHEGHITGKGYNSMTQYNLVHKFIPIPQATQISDAKAAVNKQGRSPKRFQVGSG